MGVGCRGVGMEDRGWWAWNVLSFPLFAATCRDLATIFRYFPPFVDIFKYLLMLFAVCNYFLLCAVIAGYFRLFATICSLFAVISRYCPRRYFL